MTLEEFAKKAGVELIACEPEWGGRIAYKTPDAPNCCICGFRNAGAAYKHWLENTFGELAGKAVMSLLAKPKRTAGVQACLSLGIIECALLRPTGSVLASDGYCHDCEDVRHCGTVRKCLHGKPGTPGVVVRQTTEEKS